MYLHLSTFYVFQVRADSSKKRLHLQTRVVCGIFPDHYNISWGNEIGRAELQATGCTPPTPQPANQLLLLHPAVVCRWLLAPSAAWNYIVALEISRTEILRVITLTKSKLLTKCHTSQNLQSILCLSEWMDRWMKCVYQHAQGGKRLQEAGCRPEQGEAEAEESQSNATNQDTC